MSLLVAAHHTKGTLNANVTVESGETIRVHSISITNKTGGVITVPIQYADGSDTYDSVVVSTNETYNYDTPFLADHGLRIGSVGDANATVTVYHGSGGA